MEQVTHWAAEDYQTAEINLEFSSDYRVKYKKLQIDKYKWRMS